MSTDSKENQGDCWTFGQLQGFLSKCTSLLNWKQAWKLTLNPVGRKNILQDPRQFCLSYNGESKRHTRQK